MPDLKEILKEFVATANAGEYKTEGELLSAFPELSGYNSNTLKEFVATANAGEYTSEDELLAAFPEFGEPVKKKEESVPLWLQKQEQQQPKPKQEQTPPFLESKPSGISLGSQRVPETAPMFEAPPMRTAEDAQAIVETPEDGSYIDNLYTNLGLGASMFNEAVFSLPETVINLFAVPQNFIAEKTGWNVGTNADKIKETLGITNPLLDWVNEDQKVLSGEVSNYIAKNYDDAGIASNFQSGNYKDGFELLGSSITQAVPISVAILLGGMVASTEVLAATSTLGLTEGQRQELEEMDPTMSESEKTLKALSMSAAESVFSSIGQGTIGKVYRDIAKREGKEAAKGIFKDGLVQTYKTALEKGGMAAGFVGEGIEEAATQITQNVISGRSAFENVADAFATGAGSGVVFTAPISAINAKNYIKNKAETYATKDKIGEVLKDKADNIGNLYNVPVGTEITPDQLEIANLNKSRVLLENNLKKNVKDGKITPDDAKQSLYVFDKIQQVSNSVKDLNVDKEDKAKIATLLSKRNDLANKIKNQDDVLVVQEKQQVEQINKQIEEILLKPKEDAIQEPSTEEGVLRAEESQVGLPEVGEGDTKVQAPAEEVVQEEVVDEEAQASIDRLLSLDETEAVPAKTPVVEAIDSSTKSDVEIEKRMSEIEGDNKYTDEFNSLEKEMEKRERDTIFNVPLEKVNDAVDVLIGKEKEMPNGFGTFVEKGDAIEVKKVADRYLNSKELTDAELMKDFSDAVRGNPTTSYADGLKMREALNEATNRGIDTEVMLANVTKVYTDAGYDIETAKSVVAGMLKPVLKGSQKVSSKIQGKTTFIKKPRKINDNLYEFEDAIGVGYIAKKRVGEDAKPRWIVVTSPESFEFDHDPFTNLKDAVNYIERANRRQAAVKAKSVPIPVAIPKPAPAPAPKPVAVEQSTATEPTTIYASDGSLFQAYMKDEIGKAFRNLGFKKFANLFRKHVDPSFSRANNTKTAGGQVDKDFTFEELAGYIIGDGTYSITEDQYRAFAKEAGIDMPAPAPKPVAVEGKFKKLKSLKDIQEDPRVESIYKERDDEGVSWWIELKDGYEWAYNSQIIHEYTVNGLLGVMNNDVQAVAKTAPQTTPTAVAPAPAPAPKPVAVVSQPQEDVKIYSYNGKNYEIKRLSVKEVGTDKGLPLEFGRIIKAQGKLLTPAAPVVAKAKTKAAPKAKVEPVKVAPAIVSKPAPASKPVIVPAPTTIVGPVQLREAHMASVNAVRIDQTLTQRQKDAKVDALKVEYQARKAEMESTTPAAAKPKTEAKAKTKAAPKKVEVKAGTVVKSKFQEAQDFADKLSAMSQEERDDVEFDENYRGYLLFEARKIMPTTPNDPKFKKITDNNSSILYSEFPDGSYIANIDGEPYGLVKNQDPDDPDNEKAFVWAYGKIGTDDDVETMIFDNEEIIKEIKSKLPQEVKAAPKKVEEEDGPSLEDLEEVDDIVDEDEDGDEDTKDLEFKRESFGEKGIRYSDKWLSALDKQSKGSLNSGIAIPVARIILKTIKALLKTGITINQAITKIAADMNLAKKDIIESLKELDAIYLSQSALAKVRAQVNLEVTAALASKRSVNEQRKNLSNTIKEMETTGKISAAKAKVILNKIGKLNLDSKVAVEKFIDYVGKIFADAEYANKLNTAKGTRSQIRKLSKSKEKFANLRDLGSKFAGIDPSMIEDIDEYNEMATLIRDSIKGSTTRKADVKFANMIKESDAMAYINKAMEAQQKILLSQKQAEVQELLDIDASDLTYDQLMELVDSDKPLTKDNEGLIRAAINKAFRVYSSMIDASMRNGKDVFTDDEVPYTTNQKKVVKGFMSMDLSVLSPKQALEAVDALVNFLQNQSIAKMESVLAKYKGETEMRAIEKKGIKGKPIKKYGSKVFGRLLVEQTASIEIVFEREFGGFTRGGMVIDAMGVTSLINGKSKAQSESNNIVNKYVEKFYKLKPNGEAFNTALNNIERGMVAFMSRNVFGTDSEMKVEFKRRRDLIEQSTTELEKGNEQEVAKAKVYQEVYDKILKDSDSIEQVQSKAAPENLEAVKFWQEEWADKYDQLYDTALGVYNKILEKDMNYSMPDRLSKLSSDTGNVDITTEDMGFLINNGTAPLYKKETGVLMASTRPESLPKNKSTSKTNRYVDLSFDNVNSNSMYDALVDINTAAPIRQVQSALNSDSFAKIMKGTEDKELIANRIDLLVRNIRNKNPFSNDEFSKAVKSLNRLASIGVGQALGGVLAPVKQVVGVATNTFINAGGRLDVQSTFDIAKQKFMNESGYAIANRGVESQAQIESLNKMIEKAVKSKPEQAIKAIEEINNWWLKTFLVNPDVGIARASWMTYYEKSLKDQGINTESIDYNTHEINEKAANYAQRQVNRQQNISDADLAGALLSDKNTTKQLIVKVLMPFASFRMNQSARLGSDLSTIMDKTATKEDKEIATRSIGGFAVEMAVFRMISAGSALLIAAAVKGIMGRDDDEEKEKKKNDAIVRGQLTSIVADVFSPAPLLDKGIQLGASSILDATQDALDVSEEDRFEIYSGNKQDFMQSLGLLGISGARAIQLYEMSKLAAGGSYEDGYGRKKELSEEDRDAIAKLIPIAIMSNLGLAPSEVNSIVRSSLADAKRGKSEDSKIMGLNKEDLKRYYPDIYQEYYGEETIDEDEKKLKKEQDQIEREEKDEYYDYEPKDKSKSGFGGKEFGSGSSKKGGGFGSKDFGK